MSGSCLVCGSPNLYRRGRCQMDYRHLLKHGIDRSPRQTWKARHEAQLVREQEREMIRQAWGAWGA